MAKFAVSDRVRRNEPDLLPAPGRLGAVAGVTELDGEEPIYDLHYDEGGVGQWPESQLVAE